MNQTTLPVDMPTDDAIRSTHEQLKAEGNTKPSARVVAIACWPGYETADDLTWDAVMWHIRSVVRPLNATQIV